MEINHGILAFDITQEGVFHFAGFKEEPNINDYIKLYKELKDDPEFLKDAKMENILLVPACQGCIRFMKKSILEGESELKSFNPGVDHHC